MTDSPNTSDAEILDAMRLNLVPGIGPRLQRELLDVFETPASVFAAKRNDLLLVPGIGAKLADSILRSRDSDRPATELARCRESGIRVLLRGMPEYPRLLSEICDAPQLLYCKGEILPRDNLAISIVGSRRCSIYGRQQAERLGASLARAGFTVVSGLARGIDAAAHRGAISAFGRTIAVMATGVQKIYPPEHAELSLEIAENGAVVSEFPLDQRPTPGMFPQRNRIISGLCCGTLVIEATRKSGALHTCRHAMEQGREVFALPGRVDSLSSDGCHELIRDGVTLVRHADDILEALGPLVEPVQRETGEQVHSPRELTLNEREREVLNLVHTDPMQVDEVLRSTDIAPPTVLSTLTILEMKRLVSRLPGGMIVRVTR